ncbi:hypothetical protein L0244_21575 [bacterium]|nr:hypothetical protein [bacterium]
MEEIYKYIGKEALYALIAILFIAIIYSISPKIGIALAVLIGVVGIANMYASGAIKPAKS